jgi:hypothetical protein
MSPTGGTGPAAAGDPTAVELWDEVLRAYADVLDDHRGFLAVVGPDGLDDDTALVPPPFVVPSDLPPLPTELRGRADALLTEVAGLVALAGEMLVEHRPPMAPTTARPTTAGTVPTPSVPWIDRQL